ncbi:kiaa1143 [Nesidiocoris tenuis]|uniref:Kiaa1143 n=1 Tax=Nesidiocoris tenuis TaxID=355587 RepID=A0ABN7B4T6_9HEMI|nr:kiaa1143 [Nesidiocoris tenuis]
MSNRGKRNVAFIKPKEPAFLARLKQQAGYKEGPSVDTKREALPSLNSSDESDGEDQPQVVVLKSGDLTEEEARLAKKEVEEAPADISKRVIFQKPVKPRAVDSAKNGQAKDSKKRQSKEDISGRKQKQQKQLLSFDDQDGEED